MFRQISEADWKILRHLHPVALERFTQRVLTEVDRLMSDTTMSARERYAEIFTLIQRRDRELADTFDDLRRSTALERLARMQSHESLTPDEWDRFSPQTREVLRFLNGS